MGIRAFCRFWKSRVLFLNSVKQKCSRLQWVGIVVHSSLASTLCLRDWKGLQRERIQFTGRWTLVNVWKRNIYGSIQKQWGIENTDQAGLARFLPVYCTWFYCKVANYGDSSLSETGTPSKNFNAVLRGGDQSFFFSYLGLDCF